MPEWLKDLIIAIGGGTTVTIILLTALKSIVEKIVEKAIDTLQIHHMKYMTE